MIKANLADGRVLQFPDGTDPQVIQATVKKMMGGRLPTEIEQPGVLGGPEQVGQPATFKEKRYTGDPALAQFREQAAETTPFQAFGASMGRGTSKILRGLGLMEPEAPGEKAAFKALAEEHPGATFTGGTIGEAAPFMAVPVGAIPGTLGRIAAGTALGAAEGALIKRGEGASAGDQLTSAGIGGVTAAAFEGGLPFIGKMGTSLFRKIKGRTPKSNLITPSGNPTPEFTDALEEAGLNFTDFTDAAKEVAQIQKRGASPEQVARMMEFEELGIPYTKGDITKDFAQQATEERLVQSAADVAGEGIRDLRLKQSRGFTGALDDIVTKSGVSDTVGEGIKEVLTGRKATLRKRKNALYKRAAQEAKDLGEIPFPVDNIQLSVPDAATMRRLGRIQGSQVDAVSDLLVEFGIDTSKEAVERAEKAGIQVQPLTLNNFEEFRTALNQISRADQTGATQVMTGAIKDALDNEAENISKVFKSAGASDDVLATLKDARNTVRQMKTEFSPDSIAGKIIGTKRDGFTEIMEASQVFKNVVGVNKPKELLDRTVDSLRKAGKPGRAALGDLQAATVMDLMEQGFKSQTRRIEGEKVFGVVPFVKKYNAIGEDRLKTIFTGNEEAFKRLQRVKNLAESTIPDSGAVPKGSASVNLDALISVLRYIPGAKILAGSVGTVVDPVAKKMTSTKALKAEPDILKNMTPDMTDRLMQEFPSIAAALGVAEITGED